MYYIIYNVFSLFKCRDFAPLSASIIKDSECSPVDRDQLVLLNASNRGYRKWKDSLAQSLVGRLYGVVISVKDQAVVTVFSPKSANDHDTVSCELARPKALSCSDHEWLAPGVGQLNLFPLSRHVL